MDQFLKIHVADFLVVSYTFVGDNNKMGIYKYKQYELEGYLENNSIVQRF